MNLFDLYAKITLDTGDFEKGVGKTKKTMAEYKSDVMKLAQTYKSQGMSMSDAMKRAYSEIDKSQYEAAENSGDSAKKFFRNWDDAADKVGGLAGKLKTGLATAAKVGAAAIGAASTAVGFLGKAAVDSYADYEQLVGGVETLFKESAGLVAGYADNAYKTAGMSANEYMETVTSFSASLLQGLGGDTEAAAKIADRAITDMSDNANKMGTDITMIQNAYQGFAKQQYQLLDNLKLGYGGTQAEMARLINDSGVMGDTFEATAKNINEVSFDKIIEAIGVVQDRMGITGTTAAEAAETISGSVASMRASWQNLLTGIADPTQDADKLIGNFVTSVETAGNNLIPRVEKILVGISGAVEKLAPMIIDKLPVLIEAILPGILSAAGVLVASLASALPGMLGALVVAALDVVDIIKDGLDEKLPGLGAAFEIVTAAVVAGTVALNAYKVAVAISALIDKLRKVTEAQSLAQAALNAITSANPFVLFATLIAAVVAALGTLLITNEDFRAAVIAAWGNVTQFLSDSAAVIAAFFTKTIPDAIRSALEWITSIPDKMREIGSQLITGLWNGITDRIEWLKGKVSGVVDKIKGWFTGPDGFDEHSPSRWARQVFRYVMDGGGEGLDDGAPELLRNVRGITERVKSGLDFGTASVDFRNTGMGNLNHSVHSGLAAAAASGGDIHIYLTNEVGGRTVAREQYKFNVEETKRRGGAFVGGKTWQKR